MEKTEQSAHTHLKDSHQCYCHSLLQWSLAGIHTGNCLEYYGTEHDFCRALRDIHQYPLYISPLKHRESGSKTPHKAIVKRLNANTAQHWKYSIFPSHITFPARGTLAGVAFRVRRFLANSRVLTRIGRTRSNHYLAVHTWRAEGEKPGQCAAKSLVLLGRMNKEIVTCMIILHSSGQHFCIWKISAEGKQDQSTPHGLSGYKQKAAIVILSLMPLQVSVHLYISV